MKDAIQEQLITARRNQILDSATKVFASKGFHLTTIKDIAKEAGIADGTIYNYFANKTALLIGILDRMRESALQSEALASMPLATDDLRGFIKAYLYYPLKSFSADDFGLFKVIMSEIMVNKELRELYYEKILEPTILIAQHYFQQWADQKLIHSTNINLTIRTVSGIIMGVILQHVMGDPTLEAHWDELPDFITDLIIDGIGTKQS